MIVVANTNNRIMIWMPRIIAALWCMLLVAPAAIAEPSLQTSQACTRYLDRMEREHQIPAHWLSAIASTESGRYHAGLGLSVPWPWTINVQGRGYWFDSKEEAVRAVKKYKRKGISSIDIGCMQVNLHFHGEHFASIEQMFEPRYNIAYAAKFLKQNFEDSQSWRSATSTYHSKTPSLGRRYYRKVYDRWKEVQKRLDEAAYQLAAYDAPETDLNMPRHGVNVVRPQAFSNNHRQKLSTSAGKLNSRRDYVTAPGSTAQRNKSKGVLVIRVKNPETVTKKEPVKITATKSSSKRPVIVANKTNKEATPQEKGQFSPRSVTIRKAVKKDASTQVATNDSLFIF